MRFGLGRSVGMPRDPTAKTDRVEGPGCVMGTCTLNYILLYVLSNAAA